MKTSRSRETRTKTLSRTMNRLSSNFVNDSVIDNSTYFPSLSIFLTNLRSYPKEDQESAITDPVTLSLITNPVYCLGR
ncbi:MAG: hypothetical protein ACK51L_03475, partial [bacterium]